MRNATVKNAKITNAFIFLELESAMSFKVLNLLLPSSTALKDVISSSYELRGIALINVFSRIPVGS